ncbi:DUF3592 domain-containing protein [Chamaesiphon sp. VAR_69_metabat_338]|uniref:DUF3592 domain-containing protein n=1 Tax=Chamaesiphon sp. VAR_69_metabat_338 TaxID=2964704 RepID=UPI00286D7071|nr:DUF3592 domain-containing protein [Chamaesiphon sp. VAR_69_metabat_338]
MRNNRTLDKACGVLCTSIGAMLLVGFTSHYQSEISFKANAISVPGTIVHTEEEQHNTGIGGYNPSRGGNGYQEVTSKTSYISTVKFQTQQGESSKFTTVGACYSRQECKNKTVLVEYVPTAPKQARIYADYSPTVMFVVHSLFSLFCLSIGIWLLSINSRRHRV